MRCRVRGGRRGARRIFASRNDRRRGPGAARWRLLTCPGRRPIRRVQVHRVGVASGGGRIESCAYDSNDDDRDGDGTAAGDDHDGGGGQLARTHTHTHSNDDGVVGESVRGKTRRTTLVSLLCVICRARACGACVAWFFYARARCPSRRRPYNNII